MLQETTGNNDFSAIQRCNIDLYGKLNVVPNSILPGLRFFVYCICIIMWHSHLNDMEIPEAKRSFPKGFELGTILSEPNRSIVATLF